MMRPGLTLLGFGFFALFFADLEFTTPTTLNELAALLEGALHPVIETSSSLNQAILNTLSFALIGTAWGAFTGGILSIGYNWRIMKIFVSCLRSIHELFWAFLLLPIFGLTPLCGVLAIAIPFAGIFAKVYAEMFEEAQQAAQVELSKETTQISRFLYVWLPELWPEIKHYTSYRFECALRSSAVLGFIGLPTLGYHLETWFREGDYGRAFFLLYLFYLIIASLKLWARPKLLPWAVFLVWFTLPWDSQFSFDRLHTYFTQDLVPWPLRQGEGWNGLFGWVSHLVRDQAVEGVWTTLIISQLALAITAVIGLLGYPLVNRQFVGPWTKKLNQLISVVLRSTPEYLLAYLFLLALGPSMLPAVIALSLHNGAIMAHLTSQRSVQSVDFWSQKSLNRYTYESLPRVWGQFLAFLAYRWEVIVRETAILGFLGIYTLGFYVDSAFVFNRYDEALFLIAIAAILNLSVDQIGRRLRRQLQGPA